jgi:hypothetical protein
MASNDNGKGKLEEEAKSLTVRKWLRLSDDDGSDDDSSDSPEEETDEEEASSEESSMNQLDTSEEKLLVKCRHGIIFGECGDTTSPLSEPHTPKCRPIACAPTSTTATTLTGCR